MPNLSDSSSDYNTGTRDDFVQLLVYEKMHALITRVVVLPVKTVNKWIKFIRNYRIMIKMNMSMTVIYFQVIMTLKWSLMIIIAKYVCSTFLKMRQHFMNLFLKTWPHLSKWVVSKKLIYQKS